MKISLMGHACFLIETEKGIKIITDPYEPGSYSGAVGYSPVNIEANIVTVSHQHYDHNYTKNFTKAAIVDKEGKIKINGIDIEGIGSFHDKEKGALRGRNIIFVIETEGLKIVHFGDLGTLNIAYDELNNTDIALAPIGGTFTLDAKEAETLLKKINPKIFIPMHFKTPKLKFDISGVDEFLKNKEYEKRDKLHVTKDSINSFKKIVVLNYQR